jgi:hypothetical protein
MIGGAPEAIIAPPPMRSLLFVTALVWLVFPIGGARAGQVVELARGAGLTSPAVGGGRVFWATTEGERPRVFAATLSGDPELMWRGRKVDWSLDDFGVFVYASQRRVVAQVKGYSSDDEHSYVRTLSTVTAPVWSATMRVVEQSHGGYEDIEDVDGDAVLTTISWWSGEQRRLGVYVRDFGRVGAPQRRVGRVLMLRAFEGDYEDVEARISGRWVAELRHGRVSTVTVYDWRANRRARVVTLPRVRDRGGSDPYRRPTAWDVDTDGTVALSLYMRPGRAELWWANPRARARRLTAAVLVSDPFVLRDGVLTYARPVSPTTLRVYSRGAAGPARALTGPLRVDAPIASDGRVLVRIHYGKNESCLLAAALPANAGDRWRCRP